MLCGLQIFGGVRLRYKLLLLFAALLILALGTSFAFIFSDLRTEFKESFELDLKRSAKAFESQEQQRFASYGVLANFLETSPAFRNILRRSDYQTLYQYLLELADSAELDLLLVCDESGQVLARSDQEQEPNLDLSSEEIIERSLDGEWVEDYWLLEGELYQVVSVPLLGAHDYVDGTLSIGFLIDRVFLKELQEELGGELGLSMKDWSLSTEQRILAADKGEFVRESLSLPIAEETGKLQLTLGKSMKSMEKFVADSQLKLLALGLSALLLGLLFLIPLLGRVTNPIEDLELAQAEMKTIFDSNLDGLLASDESGRITSCNPAAAVALGKSVGDLLGMSLAEVLPSELKDEIEDGEAFSQLDFRRQGRHFRVYRTFVRRQDSEMLGSILLFHDVTEDLQRERGFQTFLERSAQELDPGTSQAEVRRALQNLKTWALHKAGALVATRQSIPLGELLDKLDERELSWECGPELKSENLWCDREQVLLALENLQHFQSAPCRSLNIQRLGGALRFQILNEGLKSGLLAAGIADQPFDPGQSSTDFSLSVSRLLLELQESRLQQTEDGFQFHLERAVE